MPRPETGSFNRLITSLGLLLLAAALVIPYFFYRSTDVLEIRKSELQHLTVTARGTIESRQDHIADLQQYILPLAGILIFAGAAFLVWGGSRLRGVQARDDREADARVATAEAGLRELTPREKEEKLAEEVESAEEGGKQAAPSATQVDATMSESELRQRLNAARTIERSVLETLSNHDFGGYRFRSQVAVDSLQLDGLFLSEAKNQPDVLLEVKVGGTLILPRAQEQIRSLVAKYEEERSRPCRAWFVVVLTGSPDDAGPRNLGDLRYRLNRSLDPLGIATVIRAADIPRLPRAFTDAFSD